jgi:hypothetical protein
MNELATKEIFQNFIQLYIVRLQFGFFLDWALTNIVAVQKFGNVCDKAWETLIKYDYTSTFTLSLLCH